MKSDNLDEKMRAGERYHSLRVPPGDLIVVRVDGRSFSRFTERVSEKPFDAKFHGWMVQTASALLASLAAVYVYTESDEISVLLPKAADIFDREVEKLVSLSAARASATFSLACGEPVEFDSRLWVGADTEAVNEYFRWRQSDAARCALNGWCYWTLRKAGKSVADATREMDGASTPTKIELLRTHGITFDEVPAWQRRGSGIYWEHFEKDGFNPKTQQVVKATRRRIAVNEDLAAGVEYGAFVESFLREPEALT